MESVCEHNNSQWRLALLAFSILLLAMGAASPRALGQSEQDRLDSAEAKIAKTEEREQVLTSTIDDLGEEISTLEVEVAGLRSRLDSVRTELQAKQQEFEAAVNELALSKRHLETLRSRLKLALEALRERLIEIYTSGSPDVVDVLLNSDGFEDLALRSTYLDQIQDADENLTTRVRDLRNEAKRTVARRREAKLTIEDARDVIAMREAELAETTAALEAQQGELVSARSERESALASVSSRREKLEGIAADVRAKIQAQIAEATATAAPLPAAPAPQTASSSGMIFPVDGIITSGFGPRWGGIHEGIDISAAEGTPITAAASGTVIVLQSEAESGGYGLYTCIDHGGGLSTCYAHQSGFATSAGASVAQGELIGYVGNTGHSFGAHLHFEVRVDGVAQDPLGYL